MDLSLSKGMKIVWGDGHQSQYALGYLRKNCPCATCRTESKKQTNPLHVLPKAPPTAITVTHAELVGNYALQLAFSDGHSTGIYDFRYLRSIDPGPSPGQ